MSSDRPAPGERALVLVLAGIQFSHIMDFMLMMPLGPQLMRAFGIGAREFGLVVSVYTFSAAISCFLAALFMDRFDRRSVLRLIYCGLVIGTFLCGLAPTFQLLLAARIVTGLFGGLLQAIILAVVGDVVQEGRRGRAIGLVFAAFSVATVAGIPVGLWLANLAGWHATFLSLGALSAVNYLLAWKIVPPVREHLHASRPQGVIAGIVSLLKEANTWLAVAFMLTNMAVFAMLPFISPYLVSVVGVTEAQLPYIYLFGGLASLVVSPFAGRLVDRYGVKPVFTIASLASVPILVWFTNLGPSPLPKAIGVNTLQSGIGAGRMTPSMTMLNSAVEKRRRGGFMTLISSVQQLGASAFSYAGGLYLGEGPGALDRFGSLGMIIAGFALVAVALGGRLRIVRD